MPGSEFHDVPGITSLWTGKDSSVGDGGSDRNEKRAEVLGLLTHVQSADPFGNQINRSHASPDSTRLGRNRTGILVTRDKSRGVRPVDFVSDCDVSHCHHLPKVKLRYEFVVGLTFVEIASFYTKDEDCDCSSRLVPLAA